MLKIVFRPETPGVAIDSALAQSQTLYRWTSTRGRVEKPLDPKTHVQQLFIADGKDGWFIDQVTKTGQHMVDPSMDHNFYAPIVPPPDPKSPAPVRAFEIGHELDFMRSQNVSPRAVAENGTKYSLYECTTQGYTLRLYLNRDTMTPAKSEVLQDGKLLGRLVYLQYQSLPGRCVPLRAAV